MTAILFDPAQFAIKKQDYKPFNLNSTYETNGKVYTHLGFFSKKETGCKEAWVRTKGWTAAVGTLFIAPCVSSKIRAYMAGREIYRLFLQGAHSTSTNHPGYHHDLDFYQGNDNGYDKIGPPKKLSDLKGTYFPPKTLQEMARLRAAGVTSTVSTGYKKEENSKKRFWLMVKAWTIAIVTLGIAPLVSENIRRNMKGEVAVKEHIDLRKNEPATKATEEKPPQPTNTSSPPAEPAKPKEETTTTEPKPILTETAPAKSEPIDATPETQTPTQTPIQAPPVAVEAPKAAEKPVEKPRDLTPNEALIADNLTRYIRHFAGWKAENSYSNIPDFSASDQATRTILAQAVTQLKNRKAINTEDHLGGMMTFLHSKHPLIADKIKQNGITLPTIDNFSPESVSASFVINLSKMVIDEGPNSDRYRTYLNSLKELQILQDDETILSFLKKFPEKDTSDFIPLSQLR